ncbi:G5 domain-containing protein [Arcanobacterium hippocoleae]|uniref:aggregation-promoting factor C-terminal-like domain-containing protein n=1 Tax=Arcanobacterium hippocoleae TaxID=149017 RepID=UPI0033413BED
MGKHNAQLNSEAQNEAANQLRLAMQTAEVKPGSRRARREAERAAAKTQEHARQNLQNAALADGSSTAMLEVLPQGVTDPTHSALSTNKVFAEYMNENLVTSQAFETQMLVKPGLFQNARAIVVALVAATSIFSIAAAAYSFDHAAMSEAAVSASVNPDLSNTRAVEKISYKVVADGKTTTHSAFSGMTIAKALENAEVQLGKNDAVSLPLSAKIAEGMIVKIARIKYETFTEEFVDKFVNKDEADASLPKGEKKIVTPGVDGKGTRTFTVKYRDGKEISRDIVAEAITAVRVDQVTKIGTKEAQSADREIAAPPSGPAPSPGSARAIAQQMVNARGWDAAQFSCLDALWQRESGWNAHAMNRSSGAYGIPQSLPGSKMASAGADWQTNPETQIRWGLGYIQGRYGSPCGAWGHSKARGWY